MKLLLDQNISHRLANRMKDVFPDIVHLKDVDLLDFSDTQIWDFAKENHFTIITFDRDFFDLSIVRNFPPRIIYLNLYNQSIKEIEALLRKNELKIKQFITNAEFACLTLSKRK